MENPADKAILALIETLTNKADTHISWGDLNKVTFYVEQIAKLRASMNPTILQTKD